MAMMLLRKLVFMILDLLFFTVILGLGFDLRDHPGAR